MKRLPLVLSILVAVLGFFGSNLALVTVKAESYVYGKIADQCDSGTWAWENDHWCPIGTTSVGWFDDQPPGCSESSDEYCAPLGYGGGCHRIYEKCRVIENSEQWCDHYGMQCSSDSECCSGYGHCLWNSTWYQFTCGGG